MIRIVLASHGRLAEGMRESVRLIMGNTDAVTTICAYCEPGISLGEQIERTLSLFAPEDKVIVVTDVFGGSVNNEFMKYIKKDCFYLIAGMNMPLVIQLLTMDDTEHVEEALDMYLLEARKGIVNCNTLLKECEAVEEDF